MTLQILLYNQQYVYDDGNNDSVSSVTVTYAVTMSSVTVTYVVTMKTSADTAQYDYYYCDTAVSTASPPTVTVGDTNNTTSAVSIASPSIGIDTESSIVIDTEFSTVSVASNKAPSTGNDSLATVTFDTVHSLYFDITFNTAINTAFTSASHASPSTITQLTALVTS